MITNRNEGVTGVLLSGGLDSSILLGVMIRQGRFVQPFYVCSGLTWQREELSAVRDYLRTMAGPRLRSLVVLDQPLADLYGDHWSFTGRGVPGAASPDQAVYLPGRNLLLLAKAALWCQLHGVPELALGVLKSNPFGDATEEFFAGFQAVVNATPGRGVAILRPFAHLAKREVMALGCGMPLELTFSCIAPSNGRHCGCCNKCAERREAFSRAGLVDPTPYATTGGEPGKVEAAGRTPNS